MPSPHSMKSAQLVKARKQGIHWHPDETIVLRVSEMLARRWPKGMIIDAICRYAGSQTGEKNRQGIPFHLPSRETTESILTKARKDMQDRLNLEKGYHKALSLEFYESIIRDPNTTSLEKMRAQERIDNVLGNEAKFNSNTESADTTAAKIREFLKGTAVLFNEPGNTGQ